MVNIHTNLTFSGELHHPEIDRLRAENAKLKAALREIIRLDDDWVPASRDDCGYGGYLACADIARAALNSEKEEGNG